jgi:hypothetical protein
MFPFVWEKGVMIQPSEAVILFEGFLRSFCLRCFCLVGFRTLRRGAGCLFEEGFDVLGKETATQSADETVFPAQ